jgi:arsenite methyltransferase
MHEALRILKPWGRFAVFDVVAQGNVPSEVRRSMEPWVGCIAGAFRDYDYVAKLENAGLDSIEIDLARVLQHWERPAVSGGEASTPVLSRAC